MNYIEVFGKLPSLPALVYSEEILQQNFENITSGLQSAGLREWKCFFALKSCYNSNLIKKLIELGAGVECMSTLEYDYSILLGVSPTDILLNGIGKDRDLLEKASSGGATIFVETMKEFEIIEELSNKKRIKLGLRVLPDLTNYKESPYSKFDIKMGHRIGSKRLNDLLEMIASNDNLELNVIHSHGTINSDSPKLHLDIINQISLFIKEVENKYFISIPCIDIGGGMTSYRPESRKEATEYFEVIGKHFKKSFSDKEIFLEPGRYLSNNCGLFYGQILDVKTQEGVKFYFSDIATNTLIPIPTAKYYLVHPDESSQQHESVICDGVTSPDNNILRSKSIPNLEIGQKIIIGNTGAYTTVYSHNWSYCKPPIFWLSKENKLEKCDSIEKVMQLDE